MSKHYTTLHHIHHIASHSILIQNHATSNERAEKRTQTGVEHSFREGDVNVGVVAFRLMHSGHTSAGGGGGHNRNIESSGDFDRLMQTLKTGT